MIGLGSTSRKVSSRPLLCALAQQRCIGSGRPVKKGKVSAPLGVPAGIPAPPYAKSGEDPLSGQTFSVFDLGSAEMQSMRDACKYARDTLEFAGELVKPGVTTDFIDRKVHEFLVGQGIYPSPYNYRGFPKSLCSSVNEVMCHGIPDDRELEEGDIVNLDVSCFFEGHHGDTSRTFRVGQVSEAANNLVNRGEECLMECIKAMGPGVPLNTVGKIVDETCAKYGYEANKVFCGHGIGSTFHMLPYVLHFDNNDSLPLMPGMVFTIEPILCEGSQRHIVWPDGWTIASEDGGLSSQFEHTIVITDNGHEILT